MLVRDIAKARIGQFAIISGVLSITDVSIASRLLALPHLAEASAAIQETSEWKEHFKIKPETSRAGNELLKAVSGELKNTIHATVSSGDVLVWCSLIPQYLITDASDLLLKHGSVVEGKWSMLGILDASIDVAPVIPPTTFKDHLGANMATVVATLGPIVRRNLGRPYGALGITPLVILREVSG